MRSTSIAKAEKAEKLIQEGQAIKSACKSVGISPQTYYQWAEIQRKRKAAEPSPEREEKDRHFAVSFLFDRCKVTVEGPTENVLTIMAFMNL